MSVFDGTDEAARALRASEAVNHAIRAGAQAAACAAAAAAAAHGLATRFVPAWRALAPQPKTYLLTSAVVVAAYINAERAQLDFVGAHRDAI